MATTSSGGPTAAPPAPPAATPPPPASELHPNCEVLSSRAITLLFTIIRDKRTTQRDYVAASDRLMTLLAEEGLGRGVRRILGVTFEKADEAFAEADALKAKASAAEKLAGAELEKEVAAIMVALEKAVVPAADRKKLMDTCMALKKKIADAAKGNAKELAEKAKAEAEGLADAAAAGTPVVALLSVEADAKALEGAVNAVVAKRPAEACMLIGAGKALAALAVVPKDLEAKISAKDWVNESLTLAGGKGGGKPGRAQGAARDPSKAKEVEAAAKAYATGKLAVELS